MKKIVLVFFCLILACAAMAQAKPAPATAPLPAFEAYAGAGQVAVSKSGSAAAYSVNFQTQLAAGFRYFPAEKFAVDVSYFHDTVSIGRWLAVHNFIQPKPITALQYSAVGLYAEYWPVRNDHGGVFVFAGPQEFLGTGGFANKTGLAAGVGAQYVLWRGLFVESRAAFWHVQDFLGIPVANTYDAGLSVGYRF